MANIFEFLSKDGNITPEKARKGLASYCKAKTTFTFHSCILTMSNALSSINNREMKSENGFSLAFKLTLLQIEA